MKMAMVLDADSPSWLRQAQEMNFCLSHSQADWDESVLWLLFRENKPVELPVFNHAVSQVFWLKIPDILLTESVLPALIQAHQRYPAELLLFSANAFAAELATRTAMRLGGVSCLDVYQLQIQDGQCQVQQPCYANNMLASLSLTAKPWCIAVARQGRGEAASAIYDVPHSEVKSEVKSEIAQPDWLIEQHNLPVEASSALSKANRILVIGQGAGSQENVQKLHQIATALGAELAASRPVVMNAWCPMNRLIGMSGESIAPEVCIAAGVSGAPAFAVGIRQSQLVVAINTDPDAAIFAQADVGIVGDMNQVLDALVKCLEQKIS
ncbi:electron transfer flavoprotein subunit alpha/FixB family protein [Budvicia diplopodorum]|uniref:electron transfer flavoprotein subunit alpha/FixB family protein n=1 Tax=Budvicia diplopodorum TaxID=1119056 RepID=UPI00135738CE|nr:electron transfer flavoprotein subunit alpha/FixB family protein [Budvicia diplopodorum]